MVTNEFFDESREQSQIKARIVAKYFWAWAKVIIPSAKDFAKRVAYIDLFAGPGRYEDGTISTPLMVLERAIADPDMREMLVTIFNDRDAENVSKLRAAIDSLDGIKALKHKPTVSRETVGDEIVKKLEGLKLVPTFFFVDPWGYKGLSLGLINSVVKNWGCDCMFFFNYNRVNMGLSNPLVREHMDMLFGEQAESLRSRIQQMSPRDREQAIVEQLSESLQSMGARFVLPFAFKNEAGTRTTHHLVFASKHFKGYEIMKDIMAKESSEQNEGVATFEYSPASEKFPLLFELTRPLADLSDMLLRAYAGKTMTMVEIYTTHSIGRPYVKRNYKQVLASLELQGKIKAYPPAEARPKRGGESTFADTVKVIFPEMRT